MSRFRPRDASIGLPKGFRRFPYRVPSLFLHRRFLVYIPSTTRPSSTCTRPEIGATDSRMRNAFLPTVQRLKVSRHLYTVAVDRWLRI